MFKISAIILAKNEEKNISECIKCLSFCDEIIVIDDDSTDKTAEIAQKHKAKVISRPLKGNFSQQRNFSMTKAKYDWVFFVDADERVSPILQKEIIEKIKKPVADAYYLRRLDFMWGKILKHGETGSLYLLRLARKDKGAWVGAVHESWITSGTTAELENPLLHYPHVNTREFLKEINFYSTIRAKELFEQGKRTSWIQIIFYPKAKFIQNYFLRLGFLDGNAGLVFALLMSFHSFLVRGKLWQLQNKTTKK